MLQKYWQGYKDCYFIENGFICCFVTSHETLKKIQCVKEKKWPGLIFLMIKQQQEKAFFLMRVACGEWKGVRNTYWQMTNGQIEKNYVYYTIFTHSDKSYECVNFIPVYSLYYYDNSEIPTLILMETCKLN